MARLPDAVERWRERGRMLTVAGLEVFALAHGEPRDGEGVLVLHGFPTSSFDWNAALPFLGDRPVVLFDFPGFGLSEKPSGYSYSLHEQADVACLVARTLGLSRVHLVAHDMGTSVACELLARRERGLLPFEVRSLALVNGSVHIEMAHLTPSQHLLRSPAGSLFARVASRRLFDVQLRRILGRPISDEALEAMWAGLEHRGGRAVLARTIGYVDERTRFAERWIGALERLDLPALVLWGPLDPVAVFAIAERLAQEIPGARLERLEGLGHYPQLEDPVATGSALRTFLDAR